MTGFAWVTLATNDSYSLGALVLAHSLKQVGTSQQLVVLVTPGVTSPMREKLSSVFNVVKEVNILDSKDESNLRLLKRPELGVTFTKLHCWRLTQFDKCVFLDADTLVLQNCDELFEREELSAAPDVGWPDCFNSGVFVYRPSNETYEKLTQFALEKGSFDGGDQGLLNLFFSDWATKDISRHLPFIYNMCSTASYSYLPAFKQYGANAKIIHFIGATKPWLQYFNTETRRVQPSNELKHLEDVLQVWWDIFCRLIHHKLTPDMTGLAGAFAQLTLGAPRTAEQSALDDHLRRQGWEVGNIDYLGKDSFDNIWSKICETLSSATQISTPPAKEPTPPSTTPVEKTTTEATTNAEEVKIDTPSATSDSKESAVATAKSAIPESTTITSPASPASEIEPDVPLDLSPITPAPPLQPSPQSAPPTPEPKIPATSEPTSEPLSPKVTTQSLELAPQSTTPLKPSQVPPSSILPSSPTELPTIPTTPLAPPTLTPLKISPVLESSPKSTEILSTVTPSVPTGLLAASPSTPSSLQSAPTTPQLGSEITPASPVSTESPKSAPQSPQPSPGSGQSTPVKPDGPQSVPQSPQPVPQSPQPVPQSPQPVSQSPQSVPQSPQPVPQSPQPVPQSPQPVPQSPEPIPQSPQSVPQSPQPVPQSPQPTTEVSQVAPAVTKPAPIPQTPQPVPTTQAPKPSPPTSPTSQPSTPESTPQSPQPTFVKQEASKPKKEETESKPAETSDASPTPPPRKGSGGAKKSSKTKK